MLLSFRKKKTNTTDHDLKQEMRRIREHIETVDNHFDCALDPDMIDCYIYESKAAWKRYMFLLRQVQNNGHTSIPDGWQR